MTKAKVCGLKTKEAIKVAIDNHADFIGLVFFDQSPRNIDFDNAKILVDYARELSPSIQIAAVTVAPDDELLSTLKTIGIEYIQAHKINDINRVNEIKALGFKLIMAFGISDAQDLEQLKPFDSHVDYILFDAKPPKNATNAGGFGIAFDWDILKGLKTQTPWILSGGLDHENVKLAIAATNADFVDVSSGIESALGIKDITKIQKFLNAVKG